MKEKSRFLGMDFHAETIAVAIADRMAKYAVRAQLPTAKTLFASSSRSSIVPNRLGSCRRLIFRMDQEYPGRGLQAAGLI